MGTLTLTEVMSFLLATIIAITAVLAKETFTADGVMVTKEGDQDSIKVRPIIGTMAVMAASRPSWLPPKKCSR